MFWKRLRWAVVTGLMAWGGALTWGQEPIGVPDISNGLKTVAMAEYRGHLQQLRGLVASCAQSAAACDTTKIGDDERVGAGGFQVRYGWLREVVKAAHDSAMKERDGALREAGARLDEAAALADGGVPGHTAGAFAGARRATDAVLAGADFRAVTEVSYWDRMMARFWRWVGDMFGGVAEFGKKSPWVVPLLEWGSIGLAVVGLLVWVLRVMQRQRLEVVQETSAAIEVWRRESDNWAELARTEADRQEWREAVHCLYWATIVMMEGRKKWRQNRARTPREYVLLLEPGTRMQEVLRSLTQIFERIFYGLRPAGASDYERALAMFEELRVA